MPPNEGAADQGQCDLIRDIGRSGAAQGDAETAEDRLMRAAGDPFAVRAILSQADEAGPLPQPAGRLAGEATILLARSMLLHGSLEEQSWTRGRTRYDDRKSRTDEPVPPAAFAPSAKDKEQALELDEPSVPPKPGPIMTGPLLGGLALLATLAWISARHLAE